MLSTLNQRKTEDVARILGLTLTDEFKAPLYDTAREIITIGGWRGGKSTNLAFSLLMDVIRAISEGKTAYRLYWIVGPDYSQTDEEFRYLFEWTTKLKIVQKVSQPQEGSKSLLLHGNVHIETKSAQFPERLGSVAPDGIIVCEAGQVSEEVRTMLLGRTMEKTAWIRYAGTLEDDVGHTQWAWYQQAAHDWAESPTTSYSAYALPSWANAFVFGDCRPALAADPSLARFCPDTTHGLDHGGSLHPEIQLRRELFDDYTFARRIAAIPTGVQFQIYHQLTEKKLLIPLPKGQKWIRSAGGLDYGTVHPSAAVVVSENENGIVWVRQVHFQEGKEAGNVQHLHNAKAFLSKAYNCWRWNTDPNERFMAKSFDTKAVSYSESGRGFRIGLVGTRLDYDRLFFDADGPGVPALYEEMQKVRRHKQRDGELKLLRINDDRTAALEDAIEALDGAPTHYTPTKMKRQYNKVRRREGNRV